jgi:signal transduction histidine kinase/CheY-like chemotaxis protein
VNVTEAPGDGASHFEVLRENAKLKKIVRALMERVERSTDAQGNAFSLFQAAITLENTVRQRTAELQTLNAELRLAKIEAERANASKTKFFAAASHDLLQPLNVARLFTDALAERRHDAESAAIVQRIDEALDGAENLLGTLLEMSKLDAGALVAEPSDFPIDGLLRRLGNDYSIQAEERNLRLRVVACDAIVHTDPRLLERVLRNLVSNALRYTNQGGVLVGCRRRAGALRVEVWDTGIGIPEDRVGEIFEEFRQLAVAGRPREGVGLGLAIVERIARLLELKTDVRSRPGRGSVFALDVPLGDVARYRPPSPHRPHQTLNPLAGKIALLVDDDPGALEGLELVMRGWGCETRRAASVREALATCGGAARPPDVIVADYHLGQGTTGLDAIARVRESVEARVPGIIVTGERRSELDELAAAHGCWLLTKPARLDRLRALLHHLASAGSAARDYEPNANT